MKREIFNEVIKKVEETTGVNRDNMMKCTSEECTDARYILIMALCKLGMSDTEIGKFIGRTRQAVNYLKNSYKKVNKWTIANDWQAVSKWVSNEYLTSK